MKYITWHLTQKNIYDTLLIDGTMGKWDDVVTFSDIPINMVH